MIHGISDVRRLRRLGRVRLGMKVKNANGKEYPKALDRFNFEGAPELLQLFGENCREMDVMLPNENVDAFFPQERKAYRATGLFCRGDGERAIRVNVGLSDGKNSQKVAPGQPLDPEGLRYIKEHKLDVKPGAMFELPCLGEDCSFTLQNFCKPIGRFLFLIPNAPRVGCYEISTTSFNSIVELNSSIDTVRGIAGRVSMIPLKLKLVPKEAQVNGIKKSIYHLVLEYHGTFAELANYRNIKEIPLDRLPSRAELDREVPDDLVPRGGAALEEHLGPQPAAAQPPVEEEAPPEEVSGYEAGAGPDDLGEAPPPARQPEPARSVPAAVVEQPRPRPAPPPAAKPKRSLFK